MQAHEVLVGARVSLACAIDELLLFWGRPAAQRLGYAVRRVGVPAHALIIAGTAAAAAA